MSEFNPVENLSLEQLRDEVWFWRIDAAARMFFSIDAVKQSRPTTADGRERRRHLTGEAETLSDALAGRYHPNCFACATPIVPGMAVINDVNEGDMHASCGDPAAIKPGDKVFMDPESIVTDEDHPEGGDPATKPDHIVAHEATRLYAHEQIVARVEAAKAALG